jgi:hypothetical protein
MQLSFGSLMQMFQLEGLIALGQIENPLSGTLERNLEHAQFIIELLALLQEKTQGNLSAAESAQLNAALTELRLLYVESLSGPSNPPERA